MDDCCGATAFTPLRVLIVEDEAILALDLEFLFEDLGHEVVSVASSLAEVESLNVAAQPSLAFVDMQLADGANGLQVCRFLLDRWSTIKVVFVTGNVSKIPSDFAGGHGVIHKPFNKGALTSSIRYLHEGISAPPPLTGRPADFIPSPSLSAEWQN